MTRFGYTLMTEQSGPKALVDYAIRAEAIGFDFERGAGLASAISPRAPRS